MGNSKKTTVVPSHPDPIITSVALSDGHRVYMGRENDLTDKRLELLTTEFPHVEAKNADDVSDDEVKDEVDHNPVAGGNSTTADGTTTPGGAA